MTILPVFYTKDLYDRECTEPTKKTDQVPNDDEAKKRLDKWKHFARCQLHASQNVLGPILDPSRVSSNKK